jgi:hypothetical protein
MNVYFEHIQKALVARGTKRLVNPEIVRKVKGLFAECLLFSDRITIGLHGPNLEAVTLLRWLGEENFIRLLKDNILNFVFAPGIFSYVSSEAKRKLELRAGPGLEWWVGMEPEWGDPYQATFVVLNELTEYDRSSKRKIARLVEKHSIIQDNLAIYNDS